MAFGVFFGFSSTFLSGRATTLLLQKFSRGAFGSVRMDSNKTNKTSEKTLVIFIQTFNNNIIDK